MNYLDKLRSKKNPDILIVYIKINYLYFLMHFKDEYIQMNKIKSAQNQNQNQPDPLIPCVSKFDRYKHQDENDDDMEDGKIKLNSKYSKYF